MTGHYREKESFREAIQVIIEQTKNLGSLYDVEIDHQEQTIPRILDEAAFAVVKRKLTRYALNLSVREESTTKRIADDIDEGKEEEFEFDPDEGYTLGYKLPARYNLPCRHWMYTSVVKEVSLPLSLFHPR